MWRKRTWSSSRPEIPSRKKRILRAIDIFLDRFQK
jgi:hypothetical protein